MNESMTKLETGRGIKTNRPPKSKITHSLLSIVLSLIMLLSLCPVGVFAVDTQYKMESLQEATNIGKFTHEGTELDVYKFRLDTAKYNSLWLCDFGAPTLPTKGEKYYDGSKLISSNTSDRYLKGETCYKSIRGSLPDNIKSQCSEENTIGFFLYKQKRGKVTEFPGYIVIEWPENTSQGPDKQPLVDAINALPSESDTLYYHSGDRYNGKESSENGFWADMQSALQDAKSLFVDDNPQNDIKFGIEQDMVDTAAAVLSAAVDKLIPKEQLNATALYEAIQWENNRNLDASDYTHNTWSIYKNAKDEAEAYLASLFETVDGVVVPTSVNKAENQGTADSHAGSMQHAYDYELVKQSEYDAFVNGLTTSDARWLIGKSAELKPENFTADSWNAWDSAYKAMCLAMENGYETKSTKGEYIYTCRLAKEAYYSLEDSRGTISVNVRVQDNYGAKNPQWALDAFSGSYEKEITLSGDKSVAALITAMEAEGCNITKGDAGYGDQRNQGFVLLLINGELAPEYLHKSPVYSDNTKAVQLRQGDDILLLRTVVPTDTYYIHHTATPFSYGWYQSEAGIATLDSSQLSESGHIEMEAGSELDISATKISASINIRDKTPKPFAGAAVFISEAAESKEAAKASLALTNTGALTDEQGNAEFRVLESGWYKVSAVDIREQVTSQTDAYGNTIFGSLPNAVAGNYIFVYASEPADSSPVKAEFKGELDEVYSRYGEDFYGSERFAAVESAYTAACEVLANSESTIKEAFDAKESAVAVIREKISEVETENIRVVAQIEEFFFYLPDSATGLNTSNKRHFEGLKTLYEKMTAYQRSQLTTAQENLYRELLAAYGEDGSDLPAGEKHNVRIEIEVEYTPDEYGYVVPHGIFYRVNGAESGFYERFLNETGVYETELEPGDILDIYFTVNVERDFPPRLSDVEIVSGDARYKDSSHSFSFGVSYVGNRIDSQQTQRYRWQDRINVVGGNSDTVIRVSFGEKHESLSELDEAKNAALATLKTAYDGYNKPDYSAENWASLAAAYNDGMAEIRNADNVEAVSSAQDAAIAAMAAVRRGFEQSSETVGSLGSVHVVIENTTYMEAPFTGTIAEAYIPLEENTTMMTAVLDTLEGKGFAWRNSTGLADKTISYLASISKDGQELGEFDGGPQSGWMGTLNDWFTNEGFQSFKAIASRRDYRIVDGDEIRIMYTKDGYGEDLGGTWYDSDTSLMELTVAGGNLYPVFDGQIKEYLLIKDGSAVSVLPTAANKNYQVKTFVNGVNRERDVDYYRRGENIPVVAGDSINIGVGERSWLSMNNQGAEARFYSGSWYTIHIVDKESNAAVEAMINAIGRFEYSNYKDKQIAIELAGKAYDSLGESAKERVSNAEALEQASEKLTSYLEIDNVKNLLSGLVQSSRATDAQVLAAKRDIEKVDAAYKALSDEQKGYITVGDVANYNELVERLSGLTHTEAEPIQGSAGMPGSTVIEQETSVKDGKAEAVIDTKAVDAALEAAKAEAAGADGSNPPASAVTVIPTETGDAEDVTATLPKESVEKIADAGLALNVETPGGSVEIPSEALGEIAKSAEGDSISVNVAKQDKSRAEEYDLDEEAALVAEVSVTSAGKEITSFGGHTISVYLPVEESEFTEGESYEVLVISAGGSSQLLEGVCVKKDGKLFVKVEIDHLSTFIVTRNKAWSFTDVKGHWAIKGMRFAYNRGFMAGVSKTRFNPDGKLTRGMLVTMLHSLEGKPGVSGGVFSDVELGKWYTQGVAWAKEKGIVAGFADGTFRPEELITREQFATIMMSYARFKNQDVSKRADLSTYSDAGETSAWALDALKWAKATGLMSGRSEKIMAPKGTATRAEAATILMNYLKNLSE